MFWLPTPNVTFFHSKLLLKISYKFHIIEWKVKLIFRGAWNSLMAWPNWLWPSYVTTESTPLATTHVLVTVSRYDVRWTVERRRIEVTRCCNRRVIRVIRSNEVGCIHVCMWVMMYLAAVWRRTVTAGLLTKRLSRKWNVPLTGFIQQATFEAR